MKVPTPVAAVAVTALVAFAAVLGAAPVLAARSVQATTTSENMVSVGDSVARGAQCGCTPFPLQFAHGVAAHTGHPVQMFNYASGSTTSATALARVRSWGAGNAVHTSGVALVMVGANDFEVPFARVLAHQQLASRVFPRVAGQVRVNVDAIIRQLRVLRPGIKIVVLDYWNVLADGRVGRRIYGPWGLSKAVQATAYANAALRAAATDSRVTYVSTLQEFKGASGNSDPTWLLAWDGDHPNARGQAKIGWGVYRVDPSG